MFLASRQADILRLPFFGDRVEVQDKRLRSAGAFTATATPHL
jgi:hypothetical protein